MSVVTTIIRIHELECIQFLERALFSLSGQKVDVDVIIATQRFSPTSIDQIKSFTDGHIFGSLKNISILNSTREDQDDLRSHLINLSIQQVKTRYVHFLDFDDIMYPNAYQLLVSCLDKTPAAISFGAIISTYYEKLAGNPYIVSKRREFFGKSKYDLFVDNFCPIHSFLIDLSKIDIKDVLFDETMTALEDYSFLISFLSKYEGDFSMIDTPVGEYFRRESDTINMAKGQFPDPTLRLSKLEKARELILDKKRSTKVEVRVSEFTWLLRQSLPDPAPAPLGIHLPPEVNCVASSSYRINEQIGAFFAFKILEEASECKDDLAGYVDSFEVHGQNTVIKGWVDNFSSPYHQSFIFFCSKSGKNILQPERYSRPDVNEVLKTDGLEYGFEFTIPTVSFDISNDDFAVYLVKSKEGEIYRLRIHESFSSQILQYSKGVN